MPKRVVDGEALWTSSKVRRLPREYRLHYANWIPLAEANGAFEIDLDAIRGKVYVSCLDSDMTSEEVFYILREFVVAGLLRVWEDEGKIWGYFNGIEKSGRLPGEAVLRRYRDLPPVPPTDDPPVDEIMKLIESLFPKGSTIIPMPPKNITDNQ